MPLSRHDWTSCPPQALLICSAKHRVRKHVTAVNWSWTFLSHIQAFQKMCNTVTRAVIYLGKEEHWVGQLKSGRLLSSVNLELLHWSWSCKSWFILVEMKAKFVWEHFYIYGLSRLTQGLFGLSEKITYNILQSNATGAASSTTLHFWVQKIQVYCTRRIFYFIKIPENIKGTKYTHTKITSRSTFEQDLQNIVRGEEQVQKVSPLIYCKSFPGWFWWFKTWEA